MNKIDVCVVELDDGTLIRGQIQGSGGIVTTEKRLRWVMKERLQEAADKVGVPDDRMMESHGATVLAKHAGKLSVWTDPDNPEPSLRLTSVDVTRVKNIQWNGKTVWEAP